MDGIENCDWKWLAGPPEIVASGSFFVLGRE